MDNSVVDRIIWSTLLTKQREENGQMYSVHVTTPNTVIGNGLLRSADFARNSQHKELCMERIKGPSNK